MKTYPKCCNGHTHGKCYLILMLPNKLKRLFSHAKRPSSRSNIYFSNMPLKRENAQKDLGLAYFFKMKKYKTQVKALKQLKTKWVLLPRWRVQT